VQDEKYTAKESVKICVHGLKAYVLKYLPREIFTQDDL